jgi:hypothetical protein
VRPAILNTYDITAVNSVSYIQDQVSGQSNPEIVAEGSPMQADPSVPGQLDAQVVMSFQGSTTKAPKGPHIRH